MDIQLQLALKFRISSNDEVVEDVKDILSKGPLCNAHLLQQVGLYKENAQYPLH